MCTNVSNIFLGKNGFHTRFSAISRAKMILFQAHATSASMMERLPDLDSTQLYGHTRKGTKIRHTAAGYMCR